jgi:hypothetical protein
MGKSILIRFLYSLSIHTAVPTVFPKHEYRRGVNTDSIPARGTKIIENSISEWRTGVAKLVKAHDLKSSSCLGSSPRCATKSLTPHGVPRFFQISHNWGIVNMRPSAYATVYKFPYYVKFKGYFRDLKSRGYSFWKAYASNYRVYTKRFNGQEYGQISNIWQHRGGYLEVDKFMELTWILVAAIAQGEHKKWVYPNSVFRKDKKLDSLTFYVNLNDFKMLVCDANFPSNQLPNYNLIHRDYGLSDEEFESMYQEYCDNWREITLKSYIIQEIEDLLNDGLIEIMPLNF